jgi:hypothetical protein
LPLCDRQDVATMELRTTALYGEELAAPTQPHLLGDAGRRARRTKGRKRISVTIAKK